MVFFTAVNIMSWYNPSQDEAADEYYSSKSRYTNAANQRYAAARAAESCCAEKAQALTAINSCMSEKLNFERRIEDIRIIVGAIEGTGGGSSLISAMGADLQSLISKFNSIAQQTSTSYQGSMKCTEVKPVSLFDVFKNKSVVEDGYISEALQKFKDEITRLEEALKNLESQMNNLINLVNDLTSKINMYNAEQANWRKVMVSSAFEMNHFKLYM